MRLRATPSSSQVQAASESLWDALPGTCPCGLEDAERYPLDHRRILVPTSANCPIHCPPRVGDKDNAMEILQSVNHAVRLRKVPARTTEHKVAARPLDKMGVRKSPRAATTTGGVTQEVDAPMYFHPTDGGREAAGFTGAAGDCVTRAVAIALDLPYREVYDELARRMQATGKPRSARNGIPRKVYEDYLGEHGWRWFPTMHIGSGCTVHLRADELPEGRIIASLSKHVCAVIDGVVHDTHDPSRDGTRCVYGYFQYESFGAPDAR